MLWSIYSAISDIQDRQSVDKTPPLVYISMVICIILLIFIGGKANNMTKSYKEIKQIENKLNDNGIEISNITTLKLNGKKENVIVLQKDNKTKIMKYENLLSEIDFTCDDSDELYNKASEILKQHSEAFILLEQNKEFDDIYFVSGTDNYKIIHYFMRYNNNDNLYLFDMQTSKESTDINEILMFLDDELK